MFDTRSAVFVNYYRSKRIFGTSMTLSPVSPHFILKELGALNSRKSTGLDGIFARFLRDGGEALLDPISHIMYMSILTEKVPDGFKEAMVTPLFKKRSRLDPENYRPVSVLTVLSKILERAVHRQLNEYLNKKGLLYRLQSGFRGKYSTDTCLINLADYIRERVPDGKYVGMVTIDLCKAFDTVNFDILVEKLKVMCVGSLDWFGSYLRVRRQCVFVNGVQSGFLDVTCGVPQGSILGSLLFLCYINDLQISLRCDLSLYADDSALLVSGNDP
jgi:hypothetical protein